MSEQLNSTFCFTIKAPQTVRVESRSLNREAFFDWIWACFGSAGLVGVHEGTVLTEQASHQGLETESWTIDAALAPRERDWVSDRPIASIELYFDTQIHANLAHARLREVTELELTSVREQPVEDWDAQWKASFQGIDVLPHWRVRPPWNLGGPNSEAKIIQINPGAGFGTGTHETTRICLQALAKYRPLINQESPRILDFGSGSGILSIAAAQLGGQVDAVEIDPLAIANAEENAKLNQVERQISFLETMRAPSARYSIILANILRPVLLEFGEALVQRLEQPGLVILSGLVADDVTRIDAAYGKWLGMSRPTELISLEEWRGLVWLKA